jgi:toxin FitB
LLTFVTIGELTQWAKLRRWGPRNRGMLDARLPGKPVISGARSIAVLGGELSAGATQRGRPRPVNDTWAAACCLAYGLPLATLNVKDFADFAEHDGLVLIRA